MNTKIKRIKTIQLCGQTFNVEWNKETSGACFSFQNEKLIIGTKISSRIWGNIVHEVTEIVMAGMYLRHHRGDVDDDYIFVYDHRQHTAACEMIADALEKFIK